MAKRLFIDYGKCIGCETCEMVCAFTHRLPRIHMTRSRDGVMLPLYCQHCDTPKCMKVCTRGALRKDDDGAVLLNPLRCVECDHKECLIACPFAALFCNGRDTPVLKCDMCARRRAQGQEPACVEMCPCGAIVCVEREEIKTLQTPEAMAAFRRVIEHIRPPAPLAG